MLQTIREHTQGWIAAIIITLIILSFAMWGIHSYFVSNANTSTIAEVNGVDISKEQVSLAADRLKRQIAAQLGGSNPELLRNDAAIKQQALENTIMTEVLKQTSLSQGFVIADAQVDAFLQSMPEFQVNGQFSVDKFQQVLSSSAMSVSDFFDLIRTSLLVDQPKLGIYFSSFALDNETDYLYSLVNQERAIEYFILPTDYFSATPITISEDKIKAYYEANKAAYMTPEQVKVDYLELNYADVMKAYQPSDADLKSYYDENVASFKQPATWTVAYLELPVIAAATPAEKDQLQKKALSASQEIKAGTSLEKVAKKYRGKLTPQATVTLNDAPAALRASLPSLTKVGQVSAPIKTDSGYIIAKVFGVKPQHTQTLAEAKEAVKEAYLKQHAEEKFAEARENLADLTYQHPDTLSQAAEALNLKIQQTEPFTKDEGTGIATDKKIRDIAFSNDVLNLKNNSDIVQLSPEQAIVLRVNVYTPSHTKAYAEVKSSIEEKLRAEENDKNLSKFANELLAQLNAGKTPEQVLAPTKLAWQKSGYVARYAKNIDSAILEVAFRLPRDTNKMKYTLTKLSNGYAILSLKGIKEGRLTDAKQRVIFAEQVQNNEGLLEYELYKQAAIQSAKIKRS